MNPINMGIHAGLGLHFMLDKYSNFIRKGDVVIIIPEYEHFIGRYSYGEEALLQNILDVPGNDFTLVGYQQYRNILGYLPKFIIDKINPINHIKTPGLTGGVYGRNSFNEFGDAIKHYGKKPLAFESHKMSGGVINNDAFDQLRDFVIQSEQKKAKVLISFPCIDSLSYNCSKIEIISIERELRNNIGHVISKPSRYVFKQKDFFDAAYHLNYSASKKKNTTVNSGH